jgi:hypothetical protein
MSEEFYRDLGKVSALSSIIPLLALPFVFRKVQLFLIPIACLILISVSIDVTNYIRFEEGKNNLDLFHIFTIVEFTLITVYYSLFFRPYIKSLYLLIMVPVFLVVAFIDYRINGLNAIDNFSTSVESILLSLFALSAFFIVMQKMLFESILDTTFFWVNTGILIYFSGNLFLFVFSNYLNASPEANALAMWTIHSFLNILYNLLISIGFWKTQTQ